MRTGLELLESSNGFPRGLPGFLGSLSRCLPVHPHALHRRYRMAAPLGCRCRLLASILPDGHDGHGSCVLMVYSVLFWLSVPRSPGRHADKMVGISTVLTAAPRPWTTRLHWEYSQSQPAPRARGRHRVVDLLISQVTRSPAHPWAPRGNFVYNCRHRRPVPARPWAPRKWDAHTRIDVYVRSPRARGRHLRPGGVLHVRLFFHFRYKNAGGVAIGLSVGSV